MLFLLKRNDRHEYDTVLDCVVLAESETAARKLASINCDNEGPEPWLNPTQSSCTELPAHGKTRVILSHRNYG